MSEREQELKSLLERDPGNNDLRSQYEQCRADPESAEHQLLRLEREIAEALDRHDAIDALIEDYKKFRVKNSYHFWDMRGMLDHLFRSFSLWPGFMRCNAPFRT